MIVATVYSSRPGTLETGTCDPRDYGPEHVLAMREAFSRHLPRPHRFVCLTDHRGLLGEHRWAFELHHDWGGWWSKIELFRTPWLEPVLYCDLDNLIQGDITSLAEAAKGRRFIMARDWDYPVLNSSLMYWDGDFRWLYEGFRPEAAEAFKAMPLMGDQGYIESALATARVEPDVWQDLIPGVFRSRWDWAMGRLPEARMILWHGKPKPWQLTSSGR